MFAFVTLMYGNQVHCYFQVKIWVFPEGTRKLSEKNLPSTEKREYFLPFKKGAFNLAIQAQVSTTYTWRTRGVVGKQSRLDTASLNKLEDKKL